MRVAGPKVPEVDGPSSGPPARLSTPGVIAASGATARAYRWRMPADDDLRTLVLEFRASVSADLTTAHRRIDELGNEMRKRLATTELAMMNALRDHSKETDRRLGHIDAELATLRGDVSQLRGDVSELRTGMAEVLRRLDP